MAESRNQRPGGYQARQSGGDSDVQDADLRSIIHEGDAVKLNEIADRLGRYYASGGEREKLSASQIRGILDHLQRMYQFSQTELQLLRPKLAYAAGRHGGKVLELQKVADKAIVLVEADEERFKNFRNFFEAIVAYHRYHGGK
jgi:CRISPR-associated protein Csm2